MSWDTSRYLGLFVSEATEHLEALGTDVVALEKAPSAEAVQSAFRHAHSVKGMAASMGFEATSRLAHGLEDLLASVRETPGRFTKPLADLVLQAIDALQAHVAAAQASQPFPDVQPVVLELSRAVERLAVASSPTPPPQPIADTLGPPRFELALRVSGASTQPGVRGFLAYKRLSSLGNVFRLSPPLEDIKAGRLARGLITLSLETDEGEDTVRRTINAVADVELESLTLAGVEGSRAEVEPAHEPQKVVGQEGARTVRVRTELLDELLETAGELLLATSRVREVSRTLPADAQPRVSDEVDKLHTLVRGLHDRVMTARMTPLEVITDRLPRAARDIARRRGRDVDLRIDGATTELDRAIVDELGDPMLHLLRNAIDHGIEPPEERRMRGKPPRGTVQVLVRRERDRVVVEVKDDGRGMDVERLKASAVERGLLTLDQARQMSEKEALMLCTLPGVTTAASVTDISGRGVGMDVVRRLVELVGGVLELESTRGAGTTCRLSLPLTVAMAHLLLVGVGSDVYGLPIAKVSGVTTAPRASLPSSSGSAVLSFGPAVVPVRTLASLLEVPPSAELADAPPFVIVESEEGRVALMVDRLLGQQEVVLKALSRPLDLVPGLAGVTILGDGRPVFILDVARLEKAPPRGAEA